MRGADCLVEQQRSSYRSRETARPRQWAYVTCVALLVAGVAHAQTYAIEVTHPAGLTHLLVADSALIQVGTTGTPPQPTYVYRPAGRFQLRTGATVATGGNPLVAGDEDRSIASAVVAGADWSLLDFTSKVTLSVDYQQGTGPGGRFDIHDLMYGQSETTDPAQLPVWWRQALASGTRDVSGIAYLDPTGADPVGGAPMLEVRHNFTLVHDAVMLEYVVRNNTPSAHDVGLRMMIDALFGGGSNRDGSAIVLDDGSVISTEAIIPDPTNPSLVMPNTWVSYDDPDNPLVVVRGTVEAAEVHDAGIATESAGPPDEIGFGQYRNIGMTNQFDFVPNPGAALAGEDWAYAVKWQERLLQPGQSRRYVTYYGLGAASVDYDPPYALAGYAPAKLAVATGDDPSTPEVEAYYLTDLAGRSPFPVTALLDNFGAAPLINASVRMSLPSGLELWPDTQPRTISLGVVNRNQAPLPQAQWMVRATAVRPGRVEIKFTGPAGKVVNRTINIPAIPVISALPSLVGLEMVSVPYEFVSSDASNVFGSLTDSVYPGGQVALWRWDPRTAEYKTYPDPWTGNISPGKGYWLLNENREDVVLPATATPLPTNQTCAVPLLAGWEQIGNPFVVPVRFDKVRVIGPQGAEWSMADAITRGLLLPVLYSYDADANEYTWSTSMQLTELVPYQAYWLLAYSDITLLFPPPTLFAPASSAQGVAAQRGGGDGWQVGLQVAAAGQTRTGRSFGVAEGASDGMDPSDVPCPPKILQTGPGLDAYFTMAGDNRGTGYLADMKAERQGEQVWDFTVTTEAAGVPVTIRWPSLSAELPGELAAMLEDVSAGRKTYMRTSTGYTYNSDTGGARRLRVVVRPRASVTLGLMGVTCAATDAGGLAVTYSLSAAAKVDVEVRNIAGLVVRRVVSGKDSPEGQNTVAWNGVDKHGTRVPAGLYVVQVTARSDQTGQSMSVVRTARIVR